MKIYISAPITGHDLDERRLYFASIAKILVSKGYTPVNPIEKERGDETHEQCMFRDINLLLESDGILMLGNWWMSRGCRLEFLVAKECGLKVYYSLDMISPFRQEYLLSSLANCYYLVIMKSCNATLEEIKEARDKSYYQEDDLMLLEQEDIDNIPSLLVYNTSLESAASLMEKLHNIGVEVEIIPKPTIIDLTLADYYINSHYEFLIRQDNFINMFRIKHGRTPTYSEFQLAKI